MIYLPIYLIVLATALLACVTVPVAYVIWIRLVGLEPTMAQRTADLSRPTRILFALALGFGLGVALQFHHCPRESHSSRCSRRPHSLGSSSSNTSRNET